MLLGDAGGHAQVGDLSAGWELPGKAAVAVFCEIVVFRRDPGIFPDENEAYLQFNNYDSAFDPGLDGADLHNLVLVLGALGFEWRPYRGFDVVAVQAVTELPRFGCVNVSAVRIFVFSVLLGRVRL